jgi:hypothetical protein
MKIKQNKINIISVIIGRLLIYSTLYFGVIAFVAWAFFKITVYK